MAKTETVYLKGKAKWVRPTQPDPWGNWKMDLYPDTDSLDKFKKLKEGYEDVQGVKTNLKKDEEGYYITLRRPTQKIIKGKMQGFTPPEILGKDGAPARDLVVGNGSDVTVKISYYEYKVPGTNSKGSAIRWEAVRVDNLVPFEGARDFRDTEKKQVSGLAEQPEPLF